MIRRVLPLLLITILLTALITAAGLAQDEGPPGVVMTSRLLESGDLPGAMIDGVSDASHMTLNSPSIIGGVVEEEPADLCEEATEIALFFPESPAYGIGYDVQGMSETFSDPVLSCAWGTPQRPAGFRTVWYELFAASSGRIRLDTFGSQYDTILGVFRGECGSLEPVTCSDDFNGFTSNATLAASAGETYYIVVADWQGSVGEPPILNFSAFLERIRSRWTTLTTNPTSPAISRHSTVAHNGRLFVIGGQTGGAGVPIVSDQVLRLNPDNNNNWKTMNKIPGAGYSNTTAAVVGDRIYVPSGYTGNNASYDNFHWAYDIPALGDANDLGSWSIVSPIDRDMLPNGKAFAWAASAVPPSNNRYYLMGGTSSTDLFDPTTQSNDEVFTYDVAADTWLQVESMQTARYAHTGAWVAANNLGACVAGGLGVLASGEFVLHTSAECYLPGRGWTFIGDMKIPRIGAGSAVGPDGRWYVFGGLTALGEATLAAVLQTEVYDPVRNTWSLLPPEYNLGGQDLGSARAFTSGSVIGNTLYVTGGSIFVDGENAVPLTEEILLPTTSIYLPSLLDQANDELRPDDNFSNARHLLVGHTEQRNFSGQRDWYDFFTFSVPSPQRVSLTLEVPEGNNFDLYLWGENKLLWGSSTSNLNGEDESIQLELQPRRYFVEVRRVRPTEAPDKGAYYKLTRN